MSETVKLSSIKLNEKNPRKITPGNLEKLKNSIVKFERAMELKPIIIDENGVILGGNMRFAALKALKYKEIPSAWIKRAEDLTEDEKRDFIILDNAHFGDWDFDILQTEFADINFDDFGLDFEFSPAPIHSGGAETMRDAPAQTSKAAELNKTWKVESGDLFNITQNGKIIHKLLCADSTNPEDIKRIFGSEKAALICADPPYGMSKEADGVVNDNLTYEKLDKFQMAWFAAAYPFILENGSAYIWGNPESLWRLWFAAGLSQFANFTFRNLIIWDKPPSGSPSGSPIGSELMRSYPHGYEACLFFFFGEQGFNNNADNFFEGFEPIRAYLEAERIKAGWNVADMKKAAGHLDLNRDHWTSRSQWTFPTEKVYKDLQKAANGAAFEKDYKIFKKSYDEINKEYEKLRADFYATRAYFDNTHEDMTDVWNYPRVTGEDRHEHATPKPEPMIRRIIKTSAALDSLVFEPFAGTGTTIIAAQNAKRRCFAVEITPQLCAVILDRIKTAFPELVIARIKKNFHDQKE